MPTKCPCCGEEIDRLNEYRKSETKYYAYLEKDGTLTSDYVDSYDLTDEAEGTDYECPQCSECLCHDEETAVKILRGEYVPTTDSDIEETGQVPGETEDPEEEAVGNP